MCHTRPRLRGDKLRRATFGSPLVGDPWATHGTGSDLDLTCLSPRVKITEKDIMVIYAILSSMPSLLAISMIGEAELLINEFSPTGTGSIL